MSDTEKPVDEFAFDPTAKKKPKKKKAVSFDKFDADAANLEDAGDVDDVVQLGSSVAQVTLDEQEGDATIEEVPEEQAKSEDVGVFDFTAKKKKKKKVVDTADFDALAEPQDDNEETNGDESTTTKASGGESWLASDRDYTYQELLGRLFAQYREMNPDADSGEKRKYTIVPPNVQREGSKKTCFANVADISKRMRRTPDHVIQFIYAELGTSGSIDGAGRLILKGRFQQKQIETVLRRYINEYVTCKTCKSPDTSLAKENRLFFLDCEQCNSRRSVAAIKTGFSAQIGKKHFEIICLRSSLLTCDRKASSQQASYLVLLYSKHLLPSVATVLLLWSSVPYKHSAMISVLLMCQIISYCMLYPHKGRTLCKNYICTNPLLHDVRNDIILDLLMADSVILPAVVCFFLLISVLLPLAL